MSVVCSVGILSLKYLAFQSSDFLSSLSSACLFWGFFKVFLGEIVFFFGGGQISAMQIFLLVDYSGDIHSL